MRTIILPGYSEMNRDWAEMIKNNLQPKEVEVVYWKHWIEGNSPDLDNEHYRVLDMMNAEKCDVVAKSIGTWVSIRILEHVRKLILCGLPINDLKHEELEMYQKLKSFDSNKILVLQNASDPHGSYEQVKEMLAEINPNIKVLEKQGDTHDYYYSEDFKRFLAV